MSDLKQLETIAQEFINLYEITAAPIPVETILQSPRNNMWEKVDLSQMSGTFLSIKNLYSPRMSMARLLVRHIAVSDWGKVRNVPELLNNDEERIRSFARMLIMPAEMIEPLTIGARNPTAVSMQFEVPEEDARTRLQEMTQL